MKQPQENTKSKARNNHNSGLISIPWLWLLFGITIGVLLSSFIFKPETQTTVDKIRPKLPTTNNLSSINTKKNYDFYNLLTNSEENKNKSKDNINDNTKSKTLALKSSNSPSNNYLIQAGSFKKLADAESLKAKLALAGFSSNINAVQVKDKTWYRLQLGPYPNKSIAQQDQLKLQQHAITSSMLVKNN